MDQRSEIQPPLLSGFVKDPISLTRFLVILLWAHTATSVLSALTSVTALATGHVIGENAVRISAQDVFVMLVGLLQLPVVITTAVVFLMWIHRANRNARGLGARDMAFTPGWSIGWYFVPVLNLWKPYQAMKQIWQASMNPASWPTQKPAAILSTWWGLWIISNLLSNATFRMSLRTGAPSDAVATEIVSFISDMMDVLLCLVAIRVVREIIRLQSHWAAQLRQTSASTCGICRQPFPPADLVSLNQISVCAGCKPVVLRQMSEGMSPQ